MSSQTAKLHIAIDTKIPISSNKQMKATWHNWTTNQNYFHQHQQAVELTYSFSGLKNVNIFIHSVWVGGQEVSNATCSCRDGFKNQAGAGAEPTWSSAASLGSYTQPVNRGLYDQWWSTPYASCQQLLWSGKPNLCVI